MALTVRVFVRCDGTRPNGGHLAGCPVEHHSSNVDVTQLKRRLRSEGWTFVGHGLDARCLCPEHSGKVEG